MPPHDPPYDLLFADAIRCVAAALAASDAFCVRLQTPPRQVPRDAPPTRELEQQFLAARTLARQSTAVALGQADFARLAGREVVFPDETLWDYDAAIDVHPAPDPPPTKRELADQARAAGAAPDRRPRVLRTRGAR